MKTKYIILLISSLFLAACQSASSKKETFSLSGFHITDVSVSMPSQEETHKALKYSESFGSVLDNTVSRYAKEYNATKPRATKPYILNVDVEKVHFKNPVASLLVGDANRISGTATLVDRTSNQTVHTFPFTYLDGASAALNGITGAVLSVVVKKEAAEGTLSKGAAKSIMKNVFPKTALPDATKKRLKDKSVHLPITTAMSPLSSPIPTLEQSDGDSEEVVAAAN